MQWMLHAGFVYALEKNVQCKKCDKGGHMKKLLNTLYVLEEEAYLSLDGENIVCKIDSEIRQRLPLSNLESIFCFNYMGCSPALMGKCADYGIALNYVSPSGRFLARVQGATKGNILLRKGQYELFAYPLRC